MPGDRVGPLLFAAVWVRAKRRSSVAFEQGPRSRCQLTIPWKFLPIRAAAVLERCSGCWARTDAAERKGKRRAIGIVKAQLKTAICQPGLVGNDYLSLHPQNPHQYSFLHLRKFPAGYRASLAIRMGVVGQVATFIREVGNWLSRPSGTRLPWRMKTTICHPWRGLCPVPKRLFVDLALGNDYLSRKRL